MASGHLLLSCAKRAATTKIDLFAYLWQLPCALCSLILMTLSIQPAYYLVTFVFHDQRQDITTNIQHLEESVSNSGFQLDYIHTGPVIRREEIFDSYTIDERRKLIYKMLNFVVASPISHLTVCIDRRQAQDKVTLSGRLARAINIAMLEHIDYFNSFDRILVYYDNGQNELSSILNAVFSVLFSNVEFRKAEPQRYRLLQAADFICTVELLKIKQAEHRLSKSDGTRVISMNYS